MSPALTLLATLDDLITVAHGNSWTSMVTDLSWQFQRRTGGVEEAGEH